MASVASRVDDGKTLQNRCGPSGGPHGSVSVKAAPTSSSQVHDELAVVRREGQAIARQRARGRARHVRAVGAVPRPVARAGEVKRLRPGVGRPGRPGPVSSTASARTVQPRCVQTADTARKALAVAGDEQAPVGHEREAVGERLGRSDLGRGRRIVADVRHEGSDDDRRLGADARQPGGRARGAPRTERRGDGIDSMASRRPSAPAGAPARVDLRERRARASASSGRRADEFLGPADRRAAKRRASPRTGRQGRRARRGRPGARAGRPPATSTASAVFALRVEADGVHVAVACVASAAARTPASDAAIASARGPSGCRAGRARAPARRVRARPRWRSRGGVRRPLRARWPGRGRRG